MGEREQSAARNGLWRRWSRGAPCYAHLRPRREVSTPLLRPRPHSLFLRITVVLPRLVPFIDSAALSAGVTIGQSLFSPSFPAPFPGLCLCSSVTQQKARGAAPRPLNGRRPAARGVGGGGCWWGSAPLAPAGTASPGPAANAGLGPAPNRDSYQGSGQPTAQVDIASSKLLLSAIFVSFVHLLSQRDLGGGGRRRKGKRPRGCNPSGCQPFSLFLPFKCAGCGRGWIVLWTIGWCCFPRQTLTLEFKRRLTAFGVPSLGLPDPREDP